MNKKKAFITGICGQDGSYLAELLLAEGFDVYGMCRRTSNSNTQRISHLLDDLTLVDGDITDVFSLSQLIKTIQPDHVYNLAAQSQVWVSFHEPGLTWDVTGKGCLNVLEAIKENSPHSRFYQASSSEMFGGQYSTDLAGNKYQDENTLMIPNSPYAVAKLAAFNATRIYRESYGLWACSGLLFNHETPRRGPTFLTKKVTQYVAYLYHKLNSGFNDIKKLKLGNLNAYRDWGHARDYVRAMYLMMTAKSPQDYVVCTGQTHKVEDFVRDAFNIIGVNWQDYVEIDPVLFRPSEVPFLRGRADKIKNQLGWEPQITYFELVKEMVDYDIQNYGK